MKKSRVIALSLSLIMLVAALFTLTVPAGAAAAEKEYTGFYEKADKDASTYAYSMAIVGDTQTLSDSDYDNRNNTSYVKRMDTLYSWIQDNIEAKKIGAVLGLGDIVENWQNPLDYPEYKNTAQGDQSVWEWENAARVFNTYLEGENGVKVPYTLVRGNHDSANAYNAFISSEDMATYRGQFDSENAGFYVNSNGVTDYGTSYMKLTLGTTKWLVITFDWSVTERELDWAGELISANSDHRVILTMHTYLYHDKTLNATLTNNSPNENWDYTTDMRADNKTDENPEGPVYNPDGIWERVASRYSNIELVLSGHIPNGAPQMSQLIGDNGNTVTQILIDPQSMDLPANNTSGCGMVAMLYFNEDGTLQDSQWDEKTIDLEWYSTIKDKYYKEANQFTINVDLYDGGVKTEKYGTIPAEYSDTEKYPFATFGYDKDIDEYFFMGAYSSWSDEKTGAYPALSTISGGAKDVPAYVLLRRDYKSEISKSYAMGKLTLSEVNLDLNGYTVTTGNNPFFSTNLGTANAKTTLNVFGKEGSKILNGSSYRAFIVLGATSSGAGATYTYNFNGITFGFAEGTKTTKLMAETFDMASSNNSPITISQYLNFENCTFDLETNKPSKTFTLFKLNEAEGTGYNVSSANVKIESGKIISDDLSKTVFCTKNDTDSFTANLKGDAEYFDGYGLIPSDKSDTSTYPFVFFSGNETSGYTYYSAGTLNSLQTASSIDGYKNYAGKTACLRQDRHDVKTALIPTYINGTFTIDLCGKTLLIKSAYVYDFKSSKAETTAYSTELITKNGYLESSDKWFTAVNNSGIDSTAGKNKELSYKFYDVTFCYTAGAGKADGAFFNCWTGSEDDSHYGVNVSLLFDECVFDFTNAPSSNTKFKMFGFKGSDAYQETDVVATFVGGEIITPDATGTNPKLYDAVDLAEAKNAVDGTDTANAVYFKPGDDGKLLKLTINGSSSKLPTTSLKYQSTGANGEIVTNYFVPYELVATNKYSYYLTDTIPFEVFNDETGESIGTYIAWDKAFTAATGVAKAKIEIYDDAYTIIKANIGAKSVNITVDLNGHKLYKTNDYLVSSYYENTELVEASVTFKNGSLIKTGGKYGFFCINYNSVKSDNNVNTVVANLDLLFDNVTLTNEYNASGTNEFVFSLFENGYAGTHTMGTHTDAVFNDCTFNYNGEIFKLNHANDSKGANKSVFNVVINGGALVPMKGAENRTTLFSKDSKDTVTFGKTEIGEYTRIVLPIGTVTPAYEFNGLKFVKESENGTTATYVLVPAASIGLDFTPKASVTLHSNLIFNIYIPATEALVGATLDGGEVVLGEAVDGYYLVTVELPACEAAREMVLVASLNVNGTLLKGTFTFSVPKYSAKVLNNSNAKEAEKTLVKDVLAYVQAAYNYFAEYNTADEIARVNAIVNELLALGGDYVGEPTLEGNVKDNTEIVSAVTLNLDATPSIRFYLADVNNTAIEFYANGRKLDTKPVSTDKYGTYVELDVYAYVLAETITYKLGSESGEYHITDYLAKVEADDSVENYDNLVYLVYCFVNYLEGAADYRTSVIGGNK